MRYSLASNLYLTDAHPEYSPAVEVFPEGVVEVEATAVYVDRGALHVHLETSNDRQSWTEHDPLVYVDLNGVGFDRVVLVGIGARYVRLRYAVVPSGNDAATCICSSTVRIQDVEAASDSDRFGSSCGCDSLPGPPYPDHDSRRVRRRTESVPSLPGGPAAPTLPSQGGVPPSL